MQDPSEMCFHWGPARMERCLISRIRLRHTKLNSLHFSENPWTVTFLSESNMKNDALRGGKEHKGIRHVHQKSITVINSGTKACLQLRKMQF